MFKISIFFCLQIVLSAIIALAAARPSLIHEPYIHAAPIITAPAVTKIVQPAPIVVSSGNKKNLKSLLKNVYWKRFLGLNFVSDEHVGSVISSIPTGVSSYSTSVVHGHGAVVHPVITPVHKTFISHAPIVAEPVIEAHHFAAAPALSLAHSPLAYSHLW